MKRIFEHSLVVKEIIEDEIREDGMERERERERRKIGKEYGEKREGRGKKAKIAKVNGNQNSYLL